MALGIDYHLDTMQDAYDKWVSAEGKKEQEKAAFERRQEKAARQKMKSDLLMVGHAALAIGTGGASIPYQAQFGGMANRVAMGDDYEGSQAQSLQNLGSTAYSVSNLAKAKAIEAADKKFNARINTALEYGKTLPADQRVGFMTRLYDYMDKYDTHMENLDPSFMETLDPNYSVNAPKMPKMDPTQMDPELAAKQANIERNRELALISSNRNPVTGSARGESLGTGYQYQGERSYMPNPAENQFHSVPLDNNPYTKTQSFDNYIPEYNLPADKRRRPTVGHFYQGYGIN